MNKSVSSDLLNTKSRSDFRAQQESTTLSKHRQSQSLSRNLYERALTLSRKRYQKV
jgi:hypothetical protein